MGSPQLPHLAVDLGGTNLRVALIARGEILARRESPTGASGGPEGVLQSIIEAVTPWLMQASSISVAATGRVHGGRVSAVNRATMPGWEGIPVAVRLEAAFGRPVRVMNDAHAAAWGEYRYGAGRGVADFAFVTVSTGVGAGLVHEGVPLTGARGLAAHLGFVPGIDGELFENIASGRAIAERGSLALGRKLSTAEVIAAADAADPVAEEVLVGAIAGLVDALAVLRWLHDPARVAIGGGVGLNPTYRQRLATALAGRRDVADLEVVPASLGADAGLIGAATWPQG
jgi:predicted NBD/HSP70 family sugar kinase